MCVGGKIIHVCTLQVADAAAVDMPAVSTPSRTTDNDHDCTAI